MIVCRDCGHRSADTEQFCASCGAFLEFSGERIDDASPASPAPAVDDEPASELFRRAKRALSVDNDSLAADEATQQRVSADDAALAAKVVAEREAAAAAEKAEADARAAAARLAEEERARAAAQQAAADAQRRLDELRVAHAAEAKAREEEIAAAAREEAARREAALADAERQARELVERERAEAAERVAAAQREADEHRAAAAASAEEARRREAAAREEAIAATKRLEESTAQAEAARRRAAEEADALQAAEAARAASAAEAERARAEAASIAAAAAEEVARARAEAEAARAEAAELRSAAQAEQARAQSERAAAEAAARAEEEARRARREAEERLEAERRRAADDAAAAAAKQAADDAAAERRAAEELAQREADAAAAAARAEEERARAAAQQEAAKREREEALRKAAALVAKSPTTEAASGATTAAKPTAPTSAGVPTAASSSTSGPKAAADPAPVVPAPVNPGEEQRRIAPAQVTKEPLNVGDVVCPSCGTGNGKERAYCRRCAASLAEAKPVKLGFFARLGAKRRARKQVTAGTRKGRATAAGAGIADRRAKGRVAWWKLNSSVMRIGGMLGVLALFGFGVEPIRARLHLPNVRQTVLDKIRQNATPVYDPVRPSTATASSTVKGSSAAALIDLANNTAWLAAPTASGGVGSRVVVSFDKPFDLARVLITSGIANSDQPDKGFVSQPRPSELRVTFDDDQANPVTVKVKDTAEPQTLKVSHKAASKVAFEVTGVYPAANGTGKSVAITELEFFQRRKFGDDWETLAAPKITAMPGGSAVAALTDDDLTTAWTSDGAADGVGQGFSMTFATPTDIGRIRLAPGHGEADFQSSPRPHEVQLVLTCQGRCEPTKQISFSDKPGYKSFTLNATGVTRIDVQVRSVYGTGGGVAFAELQVQRKRPKVQ